MANELRHGSVGTELTQAEWEAVGTHVLNSQATGDIVYAASSSQLSRLGRGADNTVLHLASGIPAWSATLAGLTLTTPTISSTGFANANHAHAASNSGGTISAGALSGSTLASGVTASSLTSVGTIATGVWQGTDVGVAYGGTGVSTLLTNAVLTGNGASAIQAETTLLFSSNKLIPTAAAHDAAGTVLTMSAGATTAGTTNNIAGGALTFQGGQGKGSGAGGDIIFQTANAGGSGSSLNALATALTLSDDLSATFAGDVDLNSSGDLLNVAASGNDWDSTSLRSGLIEATVTGGTTQIGYKQKNLQTKANGVGPMMAFYGHTTGQTMAYVYTVWAEESSAADTTTLNFATRNTAGSIDARMTIHGNGVLGVDLSGSGTAAQVDLFDDYDDPVELQRYAHMQSDRFTNAEERQISLDRMVDMGVVSEVPGASSGYHMNLQPMVRLLAGGIYQNRERLDAQNEAMDARLKRIEQALGA